MGGYDSLDDFETDSRSSHSNAPAEANRSHLTSAAKSNVSTDSSQKMLVLQIELKIFYFFFLKFTVHFARLIHIQNEEPLTGI